MTRRARNHGDSRWYHLFNRGARRWPIFQTDADRGSFVALLGDLVVDFGVEVHAFCLMGNHYHLVARFPAGNLAAAMARVGQVYTQRFNYHHDVDGPLFRGRFGSVVIADDRQLLTTVRYVARNPLDLSGLGCLSDYRWSSHRSYLGLRRAPAWLTTDTVLGVVGGIDAYRSLVEDEQAEPTQLDALIEEVKRLTGASEADLRTGGRGSTNLSRQLLVVAAAELRIDSLETLAGPLGYSSGSSLRSAVHRAREQRERDQRFDNLCRRLFARLR